jgi:hypothetical protein
MSAISASIVPLALRPTAVTLTVRILDSRSAPALAEGSSKSAQNHCYEHLCHMSTVASALM